VEWNKDDSYPMHASPQGIPTTTVVDHFPRFKFHELSAQEARQQVTSINLPMFKCGGEFEQKISVINLSVFLGVSRVFKELSAAVTPL
jgi:hypothetical protein